MARQLRGAVEALQAHFQGLGSSSPVERLVHDDGSVAFTVKGARVNAVFADADSYPSTAVFLSAEDNNAAEINEKLGDLAERSFQDRAPLHTVLGKARKGIRAAWQHERAVLRPCCRPCCRCPGATAPRGGRPRPASLNAPRRCW
jgi:hypothetical protein